MYSGDTAEFSTCRKFRYVLKRFVRDRLFRSSPYKRVVWIMLNPSFASEQVNDPTIRRVINFTRDWGYDQAIVVNLFPFCATYPDELRTAGISRGGEGSKNDRAIIAALKEADLVMLAWGVHGSRYVEQTDLVMRLVKTHVAQCHVLGYTKTGQPLHPLMQPSNLIPKAYSKLEVLRRAS